MWPQTNYYLTGELPSGALLVRVKSRSLTSGTKGVASALSKTPIILVQAGRVQAFEKLEREGGRSITSRRVKGEGGSVGPQTEMFAFVALPGLAVLADLVVVVVVVASVVVE